MTRAGCPVPDRLSSRNPRAAIPSSVHRKRIEPWRQVRRRGIPRRSRAARASLVAGGDGALADDDEPRLGPLVEPFGVGGSAAVVRGEEDIGRRLRGRTRDQLVETQLLEITGQEQVAPGEGDVEHEAAGVVGCLRVPAGRGVRDREPNAGRFPGLGRRDRLDRDAA